MNDKLKQKQLASLRENRLTRNICPGFSTEDWVLAWLYRHPAELRNLGLVVKPRYMTTTTGRILYTHLDEARQQGYFLSLDELDRFYRERPKCAGKIQPLRSRIARLRRVKGTGVSQVAAHGIIRRWCEARRIALHPNRRLSTEKLESAFQRAQEQLALITRRLGRLAKAQQRSMEARRNLELSLSDILGELQLRADRHVDLADVEGLPRATFNLAGAPAPAVWYGPLGPDAAIHDDPGVAEEA